MSFEILKDRTKEYYNSPEEGFFPISEVDAEILQQIYIALRGQIKESGLLSLIHSYKIDKSDKLVLNELKAWNEFKKSNPFKGLQDGINKIIEDNESNSKRTYIEIDGKIIPANFFSLEKETAYNETRGALDYIILINRSGEDKDMLVNIILLYETKELRDLAIQQIKDKLSNEINVIVIDNESK